MTNQRFLLVSTVHNLALYSGWFKFSSRISMLPENVSQCSHKVSAAIHLMSSSSRHLNIASIALDVRPDL